MGRCFGYIIANFIFTKWSVNKIVIKKVSSEMTKTETQVKSSQVKYFLLESHLNVYK